MNCSQGETCLQDFNIIQSISPLQFNRQANSQWTLLFLLGMVCWNCEMRTRFNCFFLYGRATDSFQKKQPWILIQLDSWSRGKKRKIAIPILPTPPLPKKHTKRRWQQLYLRMQMLQTTIAESFLSKENHQRLLRFHNNICQLISLLPKEHADVSLRYSLDFIFYFQSFSFDIL